MEDQGQRDPPPNFRSPVSSGRERRKVFYTVTPARTNCTVLGNKPCPAEGEINTLDMHQTGGVCRGSEFAGFAPCRPLISAAKMMAAAAKAGSMSFYLQLFHDAHLHSKNTDPKRKLEPKLVCGYLREGLLNSSSSFLEMNRLISQKKVL